MKSSWMLVAGLLFGLMGVFVKLGAAHFSYIELVFYRSFFGLLLVYIIMRQQHVSVATQHWRNHLWRGISTMLVFKDKFHLPLTAAIMLGFCGVVLLLHPTLQRDQLLPGLLGLISGFLAGIAYINIKHLAVIGEPDTRTVFYFSLIATLGSGVWLLFDTVYAITLQGFAILLGLGSSGTLAQLAMTRAYRTGRTLVVGSLAYSTIVFASLFGMLLWDETLSLSSWLGMAFIIASGMLSLRLSPQHPQKEGIT